MFILEELLFYRVGIIDFLLYNEDLREFCEVKFKRNRI